MVWIHGGGFVVGSGAEPRYDGTNLAAKGIVVVTLNHRLNALGFLAHPELTAESPVQASGNYGLLDLVAALEWVKRNIAAFGGDPGQITIAGKSAGSEAVSALMASPLARGLFHRAIGESGAMFPTPSRAPASLDDAERAGSEFMRKAGATSLAKLRSMSAKQILAAAPGLGFRPVVDGHVLPKSPAEIFAEGAQNDVPLLAGWNKDEGFNFTLLQGADANRSYPELVGELFADRAQEALSHYPGGSRKARQGWRAGAGWRPHHHPFDMGMARSAAEDRTFRDLSLSLRPGAADAGRLVRGQAKQRRRRLSCRRNPLRLQ